MEINNIQVVEYSIRQKAYHLHSVSEMVSKNTANIFDEKSIDYVPIAFFEEVKAALDFIEWHKKTMQKFRGFKKYIEPSKKFVYVQMPGSEN